MTDIWLDKKHDWKQHNQKKSLVFLFYSYLIKIHNKYIEKYVTDSDTVKASREGPVGFAGMPLHGWCSLLNPMASYNLQRTMYLIFKVEEFC